MDHLSALPLECIQHILRFLSCPDNDDNNKRAATLHALLCTNKHLAAVTLPYLYSNPFQYTAHTITYSDDHKAMEPTSPVLIRLLLTKLARLPDLDFPPIVCLAYEHSDKDQDQQIMATTKITTVTDSPFLSDYLAHIRHLDLDCMSSGDNRASHNIKISPSLRAYIQGSEYKKMCALDQTLEALLDNEGCHNVLVWCLWPVLRREVTWIIARPILEQLRSLAIPVSDITRYFGAIDRLGHLEHVRFLLDELFDYGDEYEADMSDEFVVTTQRRKAESMAAICEFVKEHTRLFKGQLKEVTCTNGLESNFLEQRCSEETLVEIAHLLPTLPRPLYLDRRNWVRFIVKHQKVDLGAVKKVVFPEEQNSWWLRTISKEREFLQRCRSLQKIKMFALGQGSFRWAVQEKRDLDRLRAADTASSASTTCLVLQQEQEQEHRLVPVRSVTIWEDTTMLVDEIDDIAIGFSCTLQRFSINASIHNEPVPLERVVHIGRGWVELPVLRKLYIHTDYGRIVLDRRLFALCPSLVDICITDPVSQYRCQDIDPCWPGHHENLDTLVLKGWSALTFDPATLNSTSKLTSLSLTTCEFDSSQCFIPPTQELNRSYGIQSHLDQAGDAKEGEDNLGNIGFSRPHWSWDWYLPSLTRIALTSEFAYRFEFRMLQGCPELTTLSLNTSSYNSSLSHTRNISHADMFVLPPPPTPSLSSSVSSNMGQEERIVAPRLVSLSLRGHWVVEDTLLGDFLSGMFPRLEYFNERCSGGITFDGVLSMIRTRTSFTKSAGEGVEEVEWVEGIGLKQLRKVTLTAPLQYSHDEMDALGVHPELLYRVKENLRGRSISKARIYFVDVTSVLPRYCYKPRSGCVVLQECHGLR